MKSELIIPRLREHFSGLAARLQPRHIGFYRSREPAQVEAPAPETVRSFRNVSKWTAIISMIVGYHVFLGWIFGIGILTSPWYTLSTMKANEAVCSVLAGLALYLLQTSLRRRQRWVVWIASGLVTLIALATLLEYLLGVSLGVDQVLFPLAPEYQLVSPAPGRMAIMSALSFLMIGLSLFLMDLKRAYRSSEELGLIAGSVSLLAIASYLYAAKSFQGQMPLYTATVIFLLACGTLSARPDRGLMVKVTSNSFGGAMARRLLPATLLIPIFLGWLQHRGLHLGLYNSEPGLALFAVANVLVFLAVIWWGVNSLYRMDTKRRLAERELQQTAAKLARSNADLEQFAYVASHDLKEPLRAISGSVQILQERYKERLDPRAEEVIRHTVDGATRMQTLIDDLLTYSRLTTREGPAEPVELREIVQAALANLEEALRESRAVVTHDPLPTVRADRTQLVQLFQNLIGNAIKYRSQRTPKIHIGLETRDQEWLFSVRDNGIGIAPQYADRIFRIFQRLHTRKEYTGTGIGLAVCKKIVERHGGRIWLESEPEEGSTFYFTLPRQEP